MSLLVGHILFFSFAFFPWRRGRIFGCIHPFFCYGLGRCWKVAIYLDGQNWRLPKICDNLGVCRQDAHAQLSHEPNPRKLVQGRSCSNLPVLTPVPCLACTDSEPYKSLGHVTSCLGVGQLSTTGSLLGQLPPDFFVFPALPVPLPPLILILTWIWSLNALHPVPVNLGHVRTYTLRPRASNGRPRNLSGELTFVTSPVSPKLKQEALVKQMACKIYPFWPRSS